MKIEVSGVKPVLRQAFLISVVVAFSSIVFMFMWNWHIADLLTLRHINFIEAFAVLIFWGSLKGGVNYKETATIENVSELLNKQAVVFVLGFILYHAKSIF